MSAAIVAALRAGAHATSPTPATTATTGVGGSIAKPYCCALAS
jgi:hypothetical protein